MSELTPKANALLIEYQNYIEEGYEATEDEWAAFGKKAVSALYETERVIATQAAEIEALRKIWKKVEKDMPGEVFVVAFWPDEYFEFDAALGGG